MKILEQLSKDSINARKNKSLESGTLVTLLAEVKMRAKNDGNREATDDDVIKTIQGFLKGLQGNRDLLEQAGRDLTDVDFEIGILQAYLPTVMDEEQTRDAVSRAVSETNPESMKDMGKAMAFLKSTFGNSIDMKLASTLLKTAIDAN